MIRGLHVDFKATLSAEYDGAELPPPMLQEYKQVVQCLLSEIFILYTVCFILYTAYLQVQCLLSEIFAELATWKLAAQPTPLIVSVVRLCGSFGKWLQVSGIKYKV